eukprot:CAMPEP_0172191826 /NCGR_PEP_ID=MMETSP1050-20130122/23950_1 /TAXON_ID=233186 /ORGANISM="Cryptomonas curvata, Strain CCAP979/52" /LENGTH=155 /DNA_ID=CAMNT_0012866985 /DNA_START=59 /DNA_END=522 /DNA_ORIENTATION=+
MDGKELFTTESYSKRFVFITIDDLLGDSECDVDFEPVHLKTTLNFISRLDTKLFGNPMKQVGLHIKNDGRMLANAIYLVGAYMVLRLGLSAEESAKRLEFLAARSAEYHRATLDTISPRDCWGGLCRAAQLGWLRHNKVDASIYQHGSSEAAHLG